MLLLGAAGLVLLIACTNIASTLMARGAARQAEVAIRSSLGAGRGRLVRQLLTESLLLSVPGAGAGLLLGSVLLSGALASMPGSVPRAEGIGLDAWVLGFTLLASLVTALVFGLLPAIQLARSGTSAALRTGERGNAARRGGAWSGLVVAEVALSVILLVGAGLLVRSFWSVLNVNPGFEAEGVLTVDVSLPAANYPTNPEIADLLQELRGELGTLPGVGRVGLVSHLPLGGVSINGSFNVEGREPGTGSGHYRVADGEYFSSLGIRLVAGRTFSPSDTVEADPVVIINQAMARYLFPGEDPIGRRIGSLANDDWVYGDDWMTIIGVVADVRHRSLTRPATRELYVHYLQRPFRARSAMLTIHTTGDPNSLVGAVRSRLRAIDDEIPARFAPMSTFVANSVADRRFNLAILGVFATVALTLAAVGVYGVVSYTVARRTREIGIRLALGAEPAQVQRRVVMASLRMIGLGAVFGILGSLALTRLLGSLLYGITATDPAVFATAVALLLGVALVASYVPARRAGRIDPTLAMRAE